MEQGTAILAVSFGTAHMDTLERSITAVEQAIAEAFADCPVYRAFLSPAVRRRLKEEHGLETDDAAGALARIKEDGYQQVVVQPTLLLRGLEYDLLAEAVEAFGPGVAVGRPLLENVRDCEVLASVIAGENPLQEQEGLLLMGHGTEHKAGSIYAVLQDSFDRMGYPACIGTMEGSPSFADAVEKAVRFGMKRAKLLPLMLVAGSHAEKNMAEGEHSLLFMARRAGIEARSVFRGLGESRNVQALYVEHVREAMGRPGQEKNQKTP